MPFLAEHGDDTATVGYPDAAGQEGGYVLLCELGEIAKASIVDVGCVLGLLLELLKERGFEADYLGIDLR